MIVSCCIWGLPLPARDAVARLREMGFDGIDVRPDTFDGAVEVRVHCLAASHGMPEGAGLDAADAGARAGAVAFTQRAIEQAAALGAGAVYLVPGNDASDEALKRYAGTLGPLAQQAQDRGMTLGLEHFPGLALPTVAATRAFVERVDHPNLRVLVDVGHAQMEGITPAAAIETAGDRLGYVHLDDNDGEGDLHLALLDGVMTGDALADAFRALQDVGYVGPVSLELNPGLEDPADALQRSLAIVRDVAGEAPLTQA